jgi:D-alanyl-D-alanine carboxypeptidase
MNLIHAAGPRFGQFKVSAQPVAGCLLLTLAALVCCARPTQIAAATRRGVVHAYILVDSQTGHILESYNARHRAHPASLTKLMTLYITFQRLETGRLSLGTRLPISRHAARQQPTKLWLRAGRTITVRNAILAITTRSANDAAVVLAEHLGGSESRFARLMNRQARLLGMTGTSFYNASGLPDRRQWTTARDMAILAMALIHNYPQYYHFFSVHAFRYSGHVIYGHNHLLDECEGVDGMKTGYVRASGFNIVTSAVRDDRRLVGVLLGGSSADSRDRQMAALINRGFKNHPAGRILKASAVLPVPSHRKTAPAKLVKTVETKIVEPPEEETAISDSREWIVEVGGNYHTQSAVRRVLHSARLSAPSPLRHSGRPLVVRLRGSRYRARFSRLERDEAIRACSALKSKKYTCRFFSHPLPRVEDADNVASNASPSTSESD